MAFRTKYECNLLSPLCHLHPAIFNVHTWWPKERVQWWGCRESEVTLSTSHHFKKNSFFFSHGGWGCGRDVDPYLMSLLSPQEEHWQLSAVQQVTRGLCRASAAEVPPYFLLPTVGTFQLLIYLLFLPHTLSMPACQARQVALTDWRILPSCCSPRIQ